MISSSNEEPALKVDQLYTKELRLYLDERDNRPEGFVGIKSNGFTEEEQILDFPVRNRRTVLHVRHRRWLTADGKSVMVPYFTVFRILNPKRITNNKTRSESSFLTSSLFFVCT